MSDKIEPLLEAVRRHVASYEPGTLVGSELNVALHLRDLDGNKWEPWCQPGDLDKNAALHFVDIVEMAEASDTHVVVPLEPTDAMRVAAVEALGKRRREIAELYRGPGREKEFAIALMADSSETDPVYRAMLAARPKLK